MVLKELSTIKRTAVNNGYSEDVIKNYIVIKLKVCRKMPKTKVKVAFYSKKTVKHLLSHTKDKIPLLEKSGVYKLNCECGAAHVGHTGCKFKDRIKEHETCAKNKNSTPIFAKHLIKENHKSDFKPKIQQREKEGQGLHAFEQLETLKSVKLKEKLLMDFCSLATPPFGVSSQPLLLFNPQPLGWNGPPTTLLTPPFPPSTPGQRVSVALCSPNCPTPPPCKKITPPSTNSPKLIPPPTSPSLLPSPSQMFGDCIC
jgi:hypothetical protein